MRGGRAAAPLLLAAIVLAAGTGASAHRHDEYLQAARIAIDPDGVRLELSLTPGIAVADAVIRDIDVDGNALLSWDEQRTYAERVLRALSLRIDGTPVPLTLAAASFPAAAALRTGDAAITLRARAGAVLTAAGVHRLSFRNGNAGHGAVYLANALLPDDDRVAINAMTHAVDQRALTVAYTVRVSRGWRRLWLSLVVAPSMDAAKGTRMAP